MSEERSSSVAPVRLVVALAAEARPVVRQLGLARISEKPFHRFRNDDVELIVSGVGSVAAAAAVGYLAAATPEVPAAWINFGIAGHRDAEIGSVRLANRIVRMAPGGPGQPEVLENAWYPPLAFQAPSKGATVCTVDRVETDFADDALYEMEAAGFYLSALRFATPEVVQVMKIVSDTASESSERLTVERVEGLVTSSLPVLGTLVDELSNLVEALRARRLPEGLVESFLTVNHFTVTERRQLEELLRRLVALGRRPDASTYPSLSSAGELLASLEESL